MKLARERSRIAVYTYAEGLFSALAHDLEIIAGDVTGEARETDGTAIATVHVPIASLRVSGVMKRGKLDTSALSAGDRATIERQIREEVLAGGNGPAVIARGERDGAGHTVVSIEGMRSPTKVTCELAVTRESEPTIAARARGHVEISLAAIGAPPVKGPLGAFRVKDNVRVEFDLLFVP